MKWAAVLFGFAAAACVDPLAVVLKPLSVINWEPSSGATCVDARAVVQVTFSDDLDIDTLTAQSFRLVDAAGPVLAELDYDQRVQTASLTPVESLQFGRQYAIMVSEVVSGLEEGPLPADLEARFKTAGRVSCTPEPLCQLNSDCPSGQLCTSLGECADQCVTSRDCPSTSTCSGGSCT